MGPKADTTTRACDGFIRPRLDCRDEYFCHLVMIFSVWRADAHAANQRHTRLRSDDFIHPLQERVSSAAAAQPDHVFRGQAERRQCQGLGRVRRLQQDNAAAGDLGQRRAK